MPHAIYILNREAAMEQGDPCLALIYNAPDQPAALKSAADAGVNHPSGLLATWVKQHEIPKQAGKIITLEHAD